LIFEDDVVFHPDLKRLFDEFVKQLPADWDMLYLGGLHIYKQPLKISENIFKLFHSLSTFAYALNHTVYDRYIEMAERSLQPIDETLTDLQGEINCYCFNPHLAWVEKNYSDTHDKPTDPWHLKEFLALVTPEWDEIKSKTVAIIAHEDRTRDRSRTRNLNFTIDCYRKHFPEMEIVVIEQGRSPSVDSGALPDMCNYKFLQGANGLSRDVCFQYGFKMYERDKEFFMFVESGTHLERPEMIPNLELCARYDFVTAFDHVIDLSEEDTLKVIRGEEIPAGRYLPRKLTDICSGICLFSREGIQKVGGWTSGANGFQAARVLERLSVYQSPNRALRLHFEGRAD
jgi:hypothetical protein